MSQFMIEFTIYRTEDDDYTDGMEEIGFGATSSWSSTDQVAHDLSAIIENFEWETEPHHPSPELIKHEQETT